MEATGVEVRRRGDREPADGAGAGPELTGTPHLMWLGQQLDPGVPLYNMVLTYRIHGAVDPGAFRAAWASVVDGSDSLRTTIVEQGGRPRRVVSSQVAGEVEVVDLRSESDPDDAVDRWVTSRAGRALRFDERLWDTALLLVADDVVVWYLCQHHSISDAHSFSVVFEAVAERYELALAERLDDAAPLPQFGDFLDRLAEHRGSPVWEKAASYWSQKAERAADPTVWYGRSVSGRSARTDRTVVEVGRDRSAALRRLAASSDFESISVDVSMSSLWTALVAVLAHRVGGTSNLRIGSPFLGRRSPADRRTVGLFLEVGAVDVVIEPTDSFVSLVARVRTEMMNGIRHARPGVGTAALNRSFDVLVNYVTAKFPSFAGFPVDSTWVHTGFGDRDHALRVQVTDFGDSGGIQLHLDTNAEVFGEHERTWLVEQLDQLIDRFLHDPGRGVGSFDLLTDDRRRHQVTEFNDTSLMVPLDRTVVDLFEAQVAATPTAIAVDDRTRRLTYEQFDRECERVADLLVESGVVPGDRAMIAIPRSVDAVVAIMAVLKTGAAWVPLDVRHPASRQVMMLDDAAPTAVLVAGAIGDELRSAVAAHGVPLIDLAVPSQAAGRAVVGRRRPDDLAYMFYTSGSTGTPKGTMLTHGGLVNYLSWAQEQYTDDEPLDFALYSSLSFDLTITSLFVPLISGGRVVVYDASEFGEGLEILDVFAEDRVDVVKLTPAHLALLRDHGASVSRIRRLIVGGENLLTVVAQNAETLVDGDVEILNEYGPTEAVVGCMIHRFDRDADLGASVPIGRPAANAQIHVLDRYDQPVPPGVVGEIVVGGNGVARGYWNRPEQTAERFDADPARPGGRRFRTGDLARWGADGRLEFLGRDDHQVKIRGARIELGEIEAAIVSHPDVDSVVVDVVSFADEFSGGVENCVTCGLPSSSPGADFDERGECADCRAFAELRDEVDRYFLTPSDLRHELAGRSRAAVGEPYDSIVLVSGGKDSTYMLYQLVREYGVRPLVFLLDNGFISDEAIQNVRSSCDDLGVDLHVASTPHMNEIFVDSLERHSNVCDGCYKTIYTLSLELARRRGIGTIITGLARGQLFETRLADTFAARVFDPDQIDSMVLEARKVYHRIDDAVTRRLSGDLFDDDSIFDDVTFVDFYRYVDVGLDEVYRYLAESTVWSRPVDTGRSTNCLINDVGIHVHTTTRGFHNYALPYSWDVRLGHKRREAAMHELDDDLDLDRVRHILDEIGFEPPAPSGRSEPRLAAYVAASVDLDTSALRRHVETILPDYMIPTYFVQLDHIPLTVNGKVDRSSLPDPAMSRPDLSSDCVGPTSDVEILLHQIWSEVFRLGEIGVHDDFFQLGGDSIMCIQIVAAAQRRGLPLTPRDVFTTPTIAEIASVLGAREFTQDEPGPGPADDVLAGLDERARDRIEAAMAGAGGLDAVEDVYPLTPTQLGMLYHCIHRPDSMAYFGQGTCRFDVDVDVERLRRSWMAVCDRHPATRTRFVWAGLETPLQVVQRSPEFRWDLLDWRGRSPSDCDRELDQLLRDDRRAGFAPDADSLMSFATIRTDSAVHFVWNSHHALLDGWAAHLLHREVLDDYEAGATGRTDVGGSHPEPFRSFVTRLGSADHTGDLEWWSTALAGIESTSTVPLMSQSAATLDEHQSVVHRIDAASAARIESFARGERVTIGTMATSAWGLVLGHYGRRDDVVLGATISGRDDGSPGVDDMVGMLLATVPIRLRIDERAVGEWLRSAQMDAFEVRQHAAVGLADIQRVTDVPAGQPLFDSIVVIENYPTVGSSDAGTVRVTPLEMTSPSNYPLALLVHVEDGVEFEAVFDPARFAREDVERLVRAWERALLGLIDDAGRPVRDVPVIPDDEASAVQRWSGGAVADRETSSLPEMIGRQAIECPDETAVSGSGRSISYRELDEQANRVAHELRRRAAGRGGRVGLVVGSDPRLLIGILGILRSGAAYVPLDPDVPTSRLRHIIDETEMTHMICVDAAALPSDDVGGIDVIELSSVELERWPTAPPDPAPAPDDVAYILYTSGSTGAPKGVMVTHSNITHSTSVRRCHYGGAVDTFLVVSSLAFDSSMVGLFWTLCDGGTVVLPDDGGDLDVAHLGQLIAGHGVTHLLALPSLHRLLVEEAPTAQLQSLRHVIVAGEACPSQLVEVHRRRLPGTELHNEYGPTEGTVWSHAARLDDVTDLDHVPIGRPIPNSFCIVVDCFDQPTPVGIAGELLLGGPGVASGYVARPADTESSFVRLPARWGVDPSDRYYRTGDLCAWRADGMLDFVGRVDDQVKVRGYRIELADVEAAMSEHRAVRSVAVRAVDAPDGDPSRRRLVAWYDSEDEIDDADWRTFLSTRLPGYMVPSRFVGLGSMPLTATGKVDRDALTVPAIDAAASTAAPTDGLELELLDIWRSVLGTNDVAVDESFFDLGGNSLDAMRLVARIERRTGRALPLAVFFEAPTVAALAERIRRHDEDRSSSALVPIKPDGYKRPFFYVGPHQISVLELAKIAKHFDPERPFYGLSAPGLQPGEEVLSTIGDIATYLIDEMMRLQPRGPYLIGGHCDGSWTAHEMARQLADRGETAGYLGLVDLPPPASEFPTSGGLRRIVDRVRYYRRDGRLRHAIAWQARQRIESEVLLRFGGAAARRERSVRIAHGAAFDRYEIEHDRRTPVHMIRSTEMAVLMDQSSWYDVLSEGRAGVAITDISSTHARLLMEPETAEVAAALTQGLDVADARIDEA